MQRQMQSAIQQGQQQAQKFIARQQSSVAAVYAIDYIKKRSTHHE